MVAMGNKWDIINAINHVECVPNNTDIGDWIQGPLNPIHITIHASVLCPLLQAGARVSFLHTVLDHINVQNYYSEWYL